MSDDERPAAFFRHHVKVLGMFADEPGDELADWDRFHAAPAHIVQREPGQLGAKTLSLICGKD